MITVDEARTLVTHGVVALGEEWVELSDALGRAAAREVRASRALPSFDNSAMDGFAVRSEDVARPGAALRVVSVIAAGAVPDRAVGAGEAARIFTGAVLPEGADAVVIQEDCQVDGDQVRVGLAASAGENVRRQGGDIAVGDLVFAAGATITLGRAAMLAAQGRRQVRVVRRPRVAIVPNGDELVPIDAELTVGQVPNTNAHMLAAQVVAAGGVPWAFDPVPDDPDAIAAAFQQAAAGADLVLTTGGMSVGDFDYAREAMRAEGELDFYKVRMKPGKPLGLGRIAGVPILGLPGNPVSAFVGFELFGRPLLRSLGGFSDVDHPRFTGRLARPVRQNRTRPEFQRCAVRGDRELEPWPRQGSGHISSLLEAEVLALIPEGDGELPAGTEVVAIDLRR